MVQESDVAPAPAPAETADADRPRARLLVPLLIGGLVISLALAGTFVFLWLQSVDTSAEEVSTYLNQETTEVADISTQVATLISNYDSTNIDERRDQVLALAVGRFREQYEEIVGQGLGPAIEKAAASSRGEILQGPDISFVSASEAVAIMQTTQTTQSNDNVAGRTFLYTLRLTLLNTPDGGWKVNGFELLSSQES
ncbi:MAG: hypothetical protein M3N53_03145 [Actinomycetota bacterium]|nr:hypothetical protein [Actinomycetota bacterium]